MQTFFYSNVSLTASSVGLVNNTFFLYLDLAEPEKQLYVTLLNITCQEKLLPDGTAVEFSKLSRWTFW